MYVDIIPQTKHENRIQLQKTQNNVKSMKIIITSNIKIQNAESEGRFLNKIRCYEGWS